MSKGNPAGSGKGERPVGACSFCSYLVITIVRARHVWVWKGQPRRKNTYAAKGGGELPKGKGKGKGKFGKGKSKRKKGVFGVDEGDEAQWYSSAEWSEEGWAEESTPEQYMMKMMR